MERACGCAGTELSGACDGFSRILGRLPFPVLEVHPDNGSEFFNHHLLRFWKESAPGIQLSRSRPYEKNDNRFVEQKNSTLVRAYLGYGRLDTVAQTSAVNRLYDKMWLYYNLFQPVMRLTEKIWIRQEGQTSGVKRRFDQARTPFDRLCTTTAVSRERQEQLKALRDKNQPPSDAAGDLRPAGLRLFTAGGRAWRD